MTTRAANGVEIVAGAVVCATDVAGLVGVVEAIEEEQPDDLEVTLGR